MPASSFMNLYRPGMHIVATFEASPERLTDMHACKKLFDDVIAELKLHKVGEVYHAFGNSAFTGVICLTESHVSIHTWPEHNRVTFDVFLSNFKNDNSDKARLFYERTLAYFGGAVLHFQEIIR